MSVVHAVGFSCLECGWAVLLGFFCTNVNIVIVPTVFFFFLWCSAGHGSQATAATTPATGSPSSEDRAARKKRLKGLRKKLRQIEDLERRIASGELKSPEPKQLAKVKNKEDVLDEIFELEEAMK